MTHDDRIGIIPAGLPSVQEIEAYLDGVHVGFFDTATHAILAARNLAAMRTRPGYCPQHDRHYPTLVCPTCLWNDPRMPDQD